MVSRSVNLHVFTAQSLEHERERGLALCAYIPEHTLTQLPTIVSRMRGKRMRVWKFPRRRVYEKARRRYSLLLFLCHVSNLEGPNGFKSTYRLSVHVPLELSVGTMEITMSVRIHFRIRYIMKSRYEKLLKNSKFFRCACT